MKTIFESETCSRCGGTGEYSYCQRYGTRCFRCSGHKVTLTKRGAAAQARYLDLCRKPARAVKVGDWIETTTVNAYECGTEMAKVIAIEPNGDRFVSITTRNKRGQEMTTNAVDLESPRLVSPTREERADRIKAALQYQETLTQAGKPRKRHAVK